MITSNRIKIALESYFREIAESQLYVVEEIAPGIYKIIIDTFQFFVSVINIISDLKIRVYIIGLKKNYYLDMPYEEVIYRNNE